MDWLDEFNIGIKEIDKQHHELFNYIQQIKYSLKKDDNKNIILQKILPKLSVYTRVYLEFEEILMQKSEYPYYDAHIRQHNQFIKDLKKVLQHLQQGKILANLELYNLLNQWFLAHVIFDDKKFGEYFVKRNRQKGAFF